jgi:hypothetical protein
MGLAWSACPQSRSPSMNWVMDWCENILHARMFKGACRDEPRCATAIEKHNHSSDDCLIQYCGKYSRHSRGQALTISRQIIIRVPHA